MLFRDLLATLTNADVRFVVIGGVALVLRGSVRLTVDLDICYARDGDNLQRLADALAPHHPRLRGAPPELPFLWDAQTLRSGLNFTLKTDLGDLDVLGEVIERRLHPHAVAALAEQVAQNAPMFDFLRLARRVELLTQITSSRTSCHQLRIERVVHLAGQHLLAFDGHPRTVSCRSVACSQTVPQRDTFASVKTPFG